MALAPREPEAVSDPSGPVVLMLGPMPPPVGGMATVVDNLQRSDLGRRCRLVVLNNGKTTPVGRSLIQGVAAQVRLALRLIATARRHGAQILHLHTCSGFAFWRDSVHLVIGRLLGCRVVWHVHGGFFDQFANSLGPIRKRLLRRSLESGAAVLVLGEDWVSRLQPFAPAARWRVLPNGVAIPALQERVPADVVHLLFMGNLGSAKGVDDLVAAVGRARRQGLQATVSLAGGETAPGQRARLEARLSEEGLDVQICLLGVVTGVEKERVLSASDGFVLPSHAEGLPMSLLEAMAWGLPAIVTRVGAIPEVVTDGIEGFLVDPGDVEALANRMLCLSADATRRRQMGLAARRRVEQDFSLNRMVDRTVGIYQEILSLGPSGASHSLSPADPACVAGMPRSTGREGAAERHCVPMTQPMGPARRTGEGTDMWPAIARRIILPLHERLMRRPTFACYRDLEASQWWSLDRLRTLQLAKLRDLLSVVMPNTAYAAVTGMDPAWAPESLADLAAMPLLDKRSLSAHREELTNRGVPGGPIRYNTGGSSGEPLIFYFDKRRQAYDKAARMRAHQWFGIRPGDREAYVWGSPVELSGQDRLKNLRDWLTNEMLLSAFDLSEQSVGGFVRRLQRFRPRCLFGYPSSISLMCQLAAKTGHKMADIPVEVVFCTAEVLYDHQKAAIAEAFGGVPVVNGYGSREGGFIAHECPAGRMHITSENVIVEFIKDGKPVAPGEDGEIVVTHLDNHAMPFIRYRTGDVGQPSNEVCPCGRGLEVMKVVKGRTTDFIITPDGRWVHGLALIYVVRDIPGVQQYQIIQNDVDSIRVRVALDKSAAGDVEERIRDGLARRLGADVKVMVDRVAAIERDPSGKYRHVISQVARDRQALL